MSVYIIVEGADESAPSGMSYVKYHLPFSLYPDNSPVLNMGLGGLENIKGLHQSTFVDGMLIQYTTYQNFVAGMNLAFTINNTVPMKSLYLPYFPGARQDHPRAAWRNDDESTGDVLATADFTMAMIKNSGFTTVYVMDAHSDTLRELAHKYGLGFSNWQYMPDVDYSRYDGVIAPDSGAADRAVRVALAHGLPVFFGKKHRDPVTNRLSGFSVSKLPTHAHYLVVDDICDGGGTFIGLAEEIAKERARADLFVTHGLFTKNAAERLGRVYNEIFTTDSLGDDRDHVTVLPAIDRMFNRGDKSPSKTIYIPEGEH